MKTIVTFGVYDMLHIGHILLFKHAKEVVDAGTKLIVAVQSDDFVKKYKPAAKMVYTIEQRMFMVSAVRWVDGVVEYGDVDVDIKTIDFDIFVKGPDQCHEGFRRATDWCVAEGKELLTLPRT